MEVEEDFGCGILYHVGGDDFVQKKRGLFICKRPQIHVGHPEMQVLPTEFSGV